MDAFLLKFQHLKIQLEEITSTTNNFDDEKNRIGVGGFGNVYKGEVSHSEGRSVVAIKRLDRTGGQGTPEFLKEITMLSDYRHENLISLLGFCCEGSEMILVYEHASRGSLDRYLGSPHLMWTQRLKICLDAAKGLSYLHDPRETHRRLIHCDVKSGNILLDDQWNAKVSDLGLSIMRSANDEHSTIITLAAGTEGYIDPVYWMTHTLMKESDVYSFGVVLFEVLCGTLCYTHSNGHVQHILVPTWKECYEQKRLNDIIFKDPTIQPLEQCVLETFSDIAYRCLKDSRADRPNMAEVVEELETAFESQELLRNQEFKGEWNKQHSYYKEIAKTAEPPLNYRSKVELMKFLSKGVLLNGGKTYFSLNKKGKHYEMIDFAECLDSTFKSYQWLSEYNSRSYRGITYRPDNGIFKTHVKTQFLSTGIAYTVNLVFKFRYAERVKKCAPMFLKYKLQGEMETSVSYLAYEREDGWWMAELYQFTSENRIVDLEILFDNNGLYIETQGIEFQPLEKLEHKEDEKQTISDSDSDSDANWEEKLPTDYEDIMKRSKNTLQWTTKEEAYSIMSNGFLANNDDKEGSIWFSLDKNGKKCLMLSAVSICRGYGDTLPLPESRFGEAFQYDTWFFELKYTVQSQLVSSQTTYAVYLVYKLLKDQSGFEATMQVEDKENLGLGDNPLYIYLLSPQTPVIKPKADQNTHNTPIKLIKKSLPQQRNDSWMEVQLLEFRSATTTEMIPMLLELTSTGDLKEFRGLIIEGIEFRPI